MFKKYWDVLRTDDRFARLGWPTNKTAFLEKLDEVRQIRNAVMHFDGERLPQEQIDALYNFRNWLANLTPGV